ncbi:MAG TPA: uroporphyrinogen decarboxylase [Candidatus Limnocylindrales bacterium]|nr:uroporphyrinogen decarboxylase [Candidatus Limnocylindrales bacterium]
MTDRADRFLRACRRLPVDATPVWFMRQAGRSLPEYRAIRERATLADIVGDAALCTEVSLQPVDRLGVDAAIVFADITTPLPGAGIAVDLVDGVGPLVDRPIRTVADLDRLHPLEPAVAVGPLLEAIGLIRRASPVPVIGFAGAPFTLASYLVEGRASRRFERTKAMLLGEPALWAALLERLVDLDVAYLRAQVGAGAQAIQLFDSWVGALSPRDYRIAVAPHMRRLFEGLAGLGVPIIHFGTGTTGLLEEMATAGGDVIGLDWRVGLADGWSRVPDRAVQGNLDPAVLLADYAAAEAATDAILDEAGGRPGHIFNLGHGVLPWTDPDHLRRLVDRVHARTARIVVPG